MLRQLASMALALTVACGASPPPAAQAADGPGPGQPSRTTASSSMPNKTTPAASLDAGSLRHTLLVRIDRDFGKKNFAIALDGWVDQKNPSTIADVRLWWFKTHKDGERGPFSRKSSRHFDVRSQKLAADHWKVHLDTRSSRFTFDVKLDGGTLAAYAAVRAGGREISGCRATRGHLRAKTLLGAPVGIEALDLTCVTPGGETVTGPMKPDPRGSP